MNGLTSSVKTAGAMEQERRPQLEWQVTHKRQQLKLLRQKYERLQEKQDAQYSLWHKDDQERRWKTQIKTMEEDEDFNASDRV
jgi:hypothetical protein